MRIQQTIGNDHHYAGYQIAIGPGQDGVFVLFFWIPSVRCIETIALGDVKRVRAFQILGDHRCCSPCTECL